MSAGYTQDDIDTLRAAIASGVKTVSYQGPPARTITYQDLNLMRQILADMVAEVGNTAGTRVKSRRAKTSKGLT